ncbi:MAG: UDP-N-acetylmuramoyl-L-alanyl-D-glutamate--2,6-diaminopimelate ligase [Clostridiales bacterium]|nr:UDP-N-acetylmuramoyl-L-alanyl-D-glutamate--2,6-diaminopimelate ligase [Clostridiales bacterium]
MKLNQIFNCEYQTEICELTADSRKKVNNGLYFCLVGSLDGHEFASEAIKNGAVALVCEHKLDIDVPQIIVSDSRQAMTDAAAAFYFHPERKLKLIGITGTNGKTTTSFIVKSILECYKKNVAVIGTNGIFYKDRQLPSALTTPDPIELFEALRYLSDDGAEYVVMEVSAHAAALKKVSGVHFEAAAFTNLTQDHLDYFADMERYYAAKESFLLGDNRRVIINADDAYGLRLLSKITKSFSYGYDNPSDVFGINLEMSEHGLSYVLNLMDEIINVKFSLPGRFNMYNTMCAAAICYSLGVPASVIEEGIKRVKKVDGRFNIINTTSCSIIIDFAHTDDGLKNVLKAIREFSRGKIITVFGCGGNRDKSKRAKMGKAAAEESDYVVITSDNPRYEPPMDIILEAEKGVGDCPHSLIEERKEAIRFAVRHAGKNDIVLIAGKGAEKYQDIAGTKIPYSDEDFVMQLVAEEGI